MNYGDNVQSGRTASSVEQGPDGPRWERVFFNSNRGYLGYRFQDFRSGCQFRDSDRNCWNPANQFGGGDGDSSICACDYCPMVEPDIADDDDTDYSDGEEPILVIPQIPSLP
jgi:hypothetical protein